MRLFHSSASPYVRKVMVVLIETGQAADVTIVPATGNPLDPGSMPLTQNPLGKIPCLERPDGPALFDSRVICRYLDDRAGGRLYPSPPRLWETLTLEALADGILDAALLMRYETHVRPEASRSPEWIEGQWAKIARALDTVEDRWIAHLNGSFDMGQAAMACALGYIGFRHAQRDWRGGRPLLSQWGNRIAARESLASTVPTG
jgi:glutathione S-transferase